MENEIVKRIEDMRRVIYDDEFGFISGAIQYIEKMKKDLSLGKTVEPYFIMTGDNRISVGKMYQRIYVRYIEHRKEIFEFKNPWYYKNAFITLKFNNNGSFISASLSTFFGRVFHPHLSGSICLGNADLSNVHFDIGNDAESLENAFETVEKVLEKVNTSSWYGLRIGQEYTEKLNDEEFEYLKNSITEIKEIVEKRGFRITNIITDKMTMYLGR